MAIAFINPSEWNDAASVVVDSTAASNMAAIHEIDDWAADHGFERVNEYWLRQRKSGDGRRVFRGVCIRLSSDELSAREQENLRVMERVAQMELTQHELSKL